MAQQPLTTALVLSKLKKFLGKDYRDAYLDNAVRSSVAYQIQALRKKAGLSQSEFAKKLGKPQSTVCRLEQEQYGRVSLTTLLDIAKAADVGLVVRFTDYANVLKATFRMSERDLMADTIYETVRNAEFSSRFSRSPIFKDDFFSEGVEPQPEPFPSEKIGRFPISDSAPSKVSNSPQAWLGNRQ